MSADSKSEVKTKVADEKVAEKEKGAGDTTPHKRSASEVNSTEDEVKQKIQKTDHKADKENGESEDKYEEGDEEEDEVGGEDEYYDGEEDDVPDEEGDEEDDEA